jgi:uncharacterized membrane protein YeaQ/YmgE (transglycosylase-associated protein family)
MVGLGRDFMTLLWFIVLGVIAGMIVQFFARGWNKISRFVLSPLLGIVGAFSATFGGRAVGWYRADQGAGLIGATLGALAVILLWRLGATLANDLSAERSTTANSSSTDTLDISSFKRRQKYLMFLPRLLQIVYAVFVVYDSQIVMRLFVFELGLTFSSRPLSESVWIGTVASVSMVSIFVPLAIIPILYYRAFLQSSHLLFVVATLVAAGYTSYVTWIGNAEPNLPHVAIVVAVSAAAYLLYIIFARLLLNNSIAEILRRGPPSAVIAQLYRYGAKSPIRAMSNALKLFLRTSIPFFVALIAIGVQFFLNFGGETDVMSAVLSLIVLVLMIIFLRPFLANRLWYAIRRFKQENAETAAAAYEFDKRPRILLLRSFRDDSIYVPHLRSFSQAVFGLALHEVRLEESVVEVAYRYGPVGALQDPKERLKPLGAARDIATNESWQTFVRRALGEASIVLLVLGSTPGLDWELHTIEELGFLSKVIFIFPPSNHADGGLIRQVVRRLLPSVHAAVEENYEHSLLIFNDSAKQWHLVVSNQQSEQDYQQALVLALVLGGRTAAAKPLVRLTVNWHRMSTLPKTTRSH